MRARTGNAAARPRFRLTAPEPEEYDIHVACADALDKLLLPPAFWFSYPAGHIKLDGQQASRLTKVGLKRGIPDLIIIFQASFGVEIKTKGGRLSKTRIGRTKSGAPRVYVGQEDVFPQLERAGMTIAVAHSVEEMIATIHNWGIPIRLPIGFGEKSYGRMTGRP